jgi:hypothetical protein
VRRLQEGKWGIKENELILLNLDLEDCGCDSVTVCLFGMHEALGSILNTGEKKIQGNLDLEKRYLGNKLSPLATQECP